MNNRIYLNVPYPEHEYARELGAKFDWGIKKWWCYEADISKFTRWSPFVANALTYKDLSDEQKNAVDVAKRGHNILIDACIGSGKTTTVQIMCNEMKDKKILYLTFNYLLKKDAQMKIQSPNTLVTNYDGFAYLMLKKGKFQTDVEKNIRLFNKYKPNTPSYDLLILDEYQDIKEDIAEMLTILKGRNPRMQIIAVGDMQQKIYNFTALNIKGFIREFLGTHEQLYFTKCFRLSREHAGKLGELWGKKIEGANSKCETRIVHSLSEIVKFLSDKDPKDILVLGSRTGDLVKVLNELEDKFARKFNKDTVYASIRNEERSAINRNDVAIFTTFDSSKGLERKYCVVLDWTKEYFIARRNKPDVDYNILRNLFLVGASRGKTVNMFYDNPYGRGEEEQGKRNIISNIYYGKDINEVPKPERFDGELLLEGFEKPYKHPDPYTVSTMYDFLYAEDVAKCSELIETKTVNGILSPIAVKTSDGNIDLSPCIGRYVEASYFDGYDLERDLMLTELNGENILMPREVKKTMKNGKPYTKKIKWDSKGVTIEDKTLMLTAMETKQRRYCNQVDVPFITDDEKKMIKDRMDFFFDGTEQVQTAVQIDFVAEPTKGEKIPEEYEIHGICDVVKNGYIYELKFTDELKETHYLQLAFYLCAYPNMKGLLWNIKTNELVEVSVPDKKAFLKQTITAISKRNLVGRKVKFYEAGNTKFSRNEIERKSRKKKKNIGKDIARAKKGMTSGKETERVG